ncbi:bifunctional metallophosphatase/5'-nucleotidase [Hyalangium minutum]|nr:bifunctional metallophosphatase/5'-nucleotidase [Hyalangium minutum]
MTHSHSSSFSNARVRPSVFKLLGALVAGSVLTLSAGCSEDELTPAQAPTKVQLIAFNDFHGNLEPPTGSNGRIRVPTSDGKGADVNAGGGAYLAYHIDKLRQRNENTVVVSAGDLIGASPLVSGIFHDEPTIELMNLIGLDINGVGNHEFDDGRDELLRMQNGGCHANGCEASASFPGAKFKFLSANVIDTVSNKPLLDAYTIKEFGGQKIAFIGMTLEGTSTIVNLAGIVNLSFKDEADTVNALVPELKSQGVEAIVVLIHEGGAQVATGYYNECAGISGPIVALTERFDDAVDVVVSGHTHQAYNCTIDGKLVTSAASLGRLLTTIDLTLDPSTGDIVEKVANNNIVTRDNANTPADTLVKKYVKDATPLASRILGNTPVELKAPIRPLPAGMSGESILGNIVADGMLAATKDEAKGGAVIAFQNPGGIRADINAGDITFGEVFTVQPFANNLVTLTLTGAQIEKVLEQQWGANVSIMQVSEGFSYTWKESGPAGDKIDPASIMLNGTVIDPAASYRVTVNNFMASGGDGYLAFTEGTGLLTGPIDLDSLEAYLRVNNPLTVPSLGRITLVP